MSTPIQFAVKALRFAGEVDNVSRRAVEGAAISVKNSVQRQLVFAGVRNNRLSGVGKRGARVAPRHIVIGDTARVYMTGPAHLIESDTKAHRIPRERRTRRARRRVAVIPGVGVRAYVNHPGTRGKHPWKKGVAAALPTIDNAAGRHVSAAMLRAFRG